MNCAFAVTSNHLCQTRPRQHSEVVSLSLFDIERLPRLVSVSLVVCATILVIGIYGVVGVISVLDDDRMPCFLRVLGVRTLTLLRKHRTASSRCRVSEHTHHTQYSQLLDEHQLASRRNRSTVSSRVSAVYVRACVPSILAASPSSPPPRPPLGPLCAHDSSNNSSGTVSMLSVELCCAVELVVFKDTAVAADRSGATIDMTSCCREDGLLSSAVCT